MVHAAAGSVWGRRVLHVQGRGQLVTRLSWEDLAKIMTAGVISDSDRAGDSARPGCRDLPGGCGALSSG